MVPVLNDFRRLHKLIWKSSETENHATYIFIRGWLLPAQQMHSWMKYKSQIYYNHLIAVETKLLNS